MRFFIYIWFVLQFCLFQISKAQHSALFSQYQINHFIINPAEAGSEQALSIVGAYRNQWNSLEGAPITQTISIHSPLSKHLVTGLNVINDAFGKTSQQHINLNVGWRFPIHSGYLTIAGRFNYIQQRNDFSQLQLQESNDETFLETQSFGFMNWGIGAMYQSTKLKIGVSMLDIPISQKAALDASVIQYKPLFAQVSYRLNVNKLFKIEPSILVRYMNTVPLQVDLNTLAWYKNQFGLGTSYRTGDAWVMLVAFKPFQQLQIAYSYDYGLSHFSRLYKGSHELSMRYTFRYKVKTVNPSIVR